MALYTDACDYFMLGKSEKEREKSDEFFKYFTAFIDKVQRAMPAVEKPKPPPKNKMKKAASAAKGMGNVMAELKKK